MSRLTNGEAKITSVTDPSCTLWVNLSAGLLRMLAGCAHYEIGLRVGRHASTISRDLRDHARLLESHPDYAGLHSRLAHAVLEAVG